MGRTWLNRGPIRIRFQIFLLMPWRSFRDHQIVTGAAVSQSKWSESLGLCKFEMGKGGWLKGQEDELVTSFGIPCLVTIG
jgi:hypothetical protein